VAHREVGSGGSERQTAGRVGGTRRYLRLVND